MTDTILFNKRDYSEGSVFKPENLLREALRDEGASYHYLPPDEPSAIAAELLNRLISLQNDPDLSIGIGRIFQLQSQFM